MLPHEVQALMAKVLFFIFAFIVLTVGKVRAQEQVSPAKNQQIIQQIKY